VFDNDEAGNADAFPAFVFAESIIADHETLPSAINQD
jgi:hypothetical protein